MAKRFPKLIRRLKAAHGARPRHRKPALDMKVPPACAPPELEGEWVAYSEDGRRIIVSGTTFTEVFEKVQQGTTEAVSFEKLPSLDRRLF
jgi:hypothetical protein